MRINFNPAKGYTLVELLVVIAVVALLAALLVPAISRSKQKARQTKCVSNLHQLGIALQNFVADNHAYPSGGPPIGGDLPTWLDQQTWIGQLAHGGLGASRPITTNSLTASVFHCPSFPSNEQLSYGYNRWGIRDRGTNGSFGLFGRLISPPTAYHEYDFAPLPESEVVSPSDMMAIGDTFGGAIFFGPRVPVEGGQYASWNDYLLFARHQGRLDVMFCDGHVESPTLGFLFTNTIDAALVRWNRDHLPHRDQL